nr:glycosyltransferase family 4 protein [uncultured Anaerostipes sp.]
MKVILLDQIPEVNNKYSFSLANALNKNNVDIFICGIDGDDVSAYSGTDYLPIFERYSKKANPAQKILSYYRSWKKVFTYCAKHKVDVVHTQWYIFSPIDWMFQYKLQKEGIKVVVTVHDLLPFNKKFYDYYFHKKIYLNADMVIAQSKANEAALSAKFGVSKERVRYIPHGHYMEYAEFVDIDEAKEKLNINKNRRIVLFFGQIKKVKGVDILIKAMSHVKSRHPEALCVIAGKVWKDNFSTYAELIKERKLSDSIRTDIRFIDDNEIKYYFGAAEIVVLPYRQIYQSGVVLLGAAYKKPIVATNEGEFPYVIKDKKTGLLVDSENEKQLGKAINWYLDHPKEAVEHANACWNDLNERLSWDTIAKKISDVYNDIFKRKRVH